MATTETLVLADPKHYVWWFPGSPVKVHLDFKVVQRLKERLHNTATGISEEGLLFGRVLEGAVEILDFQPVSNNNVPSIIAALPNEQGKRFLMGYYRTEENETFHLNAKDISLAEECFRKPYQVFLMIHSNGFGSPNATFFFHDGDRKMADFAFLEFPFDSSLLAIEERDRIQRSHHAVIEHSVEASPSPVSSPIPPVVDRPRNKSRVLLNAIWLTGSAALVFTMGALVNNHSFREQLANLRRFDAKPAAITVPSSATPPPSSLPSMALHAKRQNGDLELTWSREAALMATATSGVIAIHDGKSERRIPLDSTQVRGGSLLYSPISDQILMQLTVTTSAGDLTESVMVILPKLGAPQTYPLPASTTSSASARPLDMVPLAKASKPFTAPSIVKGAPSPAPSALTDSPPLKINLDPVAAVAPDLVLHTPAPPPPLPLAPATPSPQPASITIAYKPAVAIRKTVPAFPAELQNLTVRRTVIEIKVTIDKKGLVSKAEVIGQKINNQYLVNSAVNAARLWIFQPARRGDEPVSSEEVLQFVFNH